MRREPCLEQGTNVAVWFPDRTTDGSDLLECFSSFHQDIVRLRPFFDGFYIACCLASSILDFPFAQLTAPKWLAAVCVV